MPVHTNLPWKKFPAPLSLELDVEKQGKLAAERQLNEYETLKCHGFVNIAETYNPGFNRLSNRKKQGVQE
jgi:hypothetical protein